MGGATAKMADIPSTRVDKSRASPAPVENPPTILFFFDSPSR